MILSYRLKRLYVRAVREKRPPEYVARGWAIGVCVGCAIPFGVQLYIAIPLSFYFKCSKIGATLGTMITNPLTILFVYPAQCWLGARVLGRCLEYDGIVRQLAHVLREQEWAALSRLSGMLVTSFFVGGFIFAAVMTPIAYYGTLAAVKGYRARRERLMANRRERFGARFFKRVRKGTGK